MLVSSGLITAVQLDEVLTMQRSSGGKLGQLLIHKKYIDERKLLEFLSKQFGIEFVDLRGREIKEDILNTEINILTPVEALMKLNEIKKLLEKK